MVESVIKPLQPTGRGWTRVRNPGMAKTGYPSETFAHQQGFLVISAVEVAKAEPGEPEKGPEYHISISRWLPPFTEPSRASSADAIWILSMFADSRRFEEDNHVPGGVVRNFWSPVADPLVGLECPCKDNEPTVKEDKGDFIWRGITR